MLEKLPDAIGHALRGQRAGLDKTALHAVDLRQGTARLVVSSLAFVDHAPIPERYTADGAGVSPPLAWGDLPPATAEVVLIVEDADAPTPQPLVHAIVRGLPGSGGDAAATGALAEGALPSADHDGEPGLDVGLNSMLQSAWLPPDPPPGHGVHRYVFQVFALEAAADAGGRLDAAPGREALLQAIAARGLASGSLIGTYARPDGSIPTDAERQEVAPMTPT